MEEQAVIDQIASLRFDADDRRVSRLMLALVKRPRVVDLEIEVHRPGFLRLEAELEGDLLVGSIFSTVRSPTTSTGPVTMGVTCSAGQFPLFVMFISKRFQRFACNPAFVVSRNSRG